jgi:diguanylate cyclase (GGDEF)-like protein
MKEPEFKTEQPDAVSPSYGRTLRGPIIAVLFVILEAAIVSIAVTGAVGTIGLFGMDLKLGFSNCLAIAGTAALLVSSWSALVRWWSWSKPARSLLRSVDQIRQGDGPIEELSKIRGHLAPLARTMQEVLHIQKLQKAELLEIEREVRGRIANRTDALERKIGSLRQQAMRDPLTGLLNRRSMEQEIPRLLGEHLSSARDACLLMIDVDHFKPLNDTLGHNAGDHLLKEIGQIIRSTIREGDMAFRCGGDEFVVVLSNTSMITGQSVSKRLESLVGVLAQPLRLPLSPRLSIGACALSELKAPSPLSWLETADKRLYAVKSSRETHRSISGAISMKKSA